MYQTIYQAIADAMNALSNIRNRLGADDPEGKQLDGMIASLQQDLESIGNAEAEQMVNNLKNANTAAYLTGKTAALNHTTQQLSGIANALSVASAAVSMAGDIAGVILTLG